MDPVALHRQLDEIAGEGVTHLVFEALSHGLDQYRLDGVRIAAADSPISRATTWTTILTSRIILPLLRLFRDLVVADGAAVISADHDCSQAVIDAARANLRILAVGRKADVREGIRLIEADIDGFAQELTLEHRGRQHSAAAAGWRI